MSLNTVTLTWDLTDLIQSGEAGTLSIQPTSQLTDTTDGLIIPALPPRLVTFTGGTGQLAGIVANDNANITPTGTGYIVTVTAPNGQVIYGPVTVVINFANGATQKLSSLTPAVIGPVVTTYMLQPTGTPTSGQVPVATGAGEASAWTTLTDTDAFLAIANNLSDLASASTARTNLGLGSAATQNSSAFAQTANNLSDLASAATSRTNLGLGAAALIGTPVSIANGGTGAASQQAALDALAGAVTSGLLLRGNGTHVTLAALQASDVPTLNQNTTGTAANVTGTVAVANGGTNSSSRVWAGLLTPTAVKTGAYTAAAGDFVPCDTTSGAFTVTLPNAPADLTVVAVKMTAQGSTNAVTIARAGTDVFNVTGGATSLTLALLFQGVLLQYKASSGIWYVFADDLPLGGLDTRYVLASALPLAITSGGTGQATQQAAVNALTGTQSAGKYLRSDGTNATLASIVAGDVPTLNQNTTGTAANVTGTVAIGNGGTGQTTAAAAYNALSPMTTLGDLEYESGASTASRLAGNTSATKNFLTQTGTGSVSAAPAWGTIASGDLPAATTSAQGAVQISTATPQPTSTTGANGTGSGVLPPGHVHAQNYGGIFGDGSDGTLTFDGSSTVAGLVPSGSTYTLTRDLLATSLTINSGVTLKPAGWRIFCQGTFMDNSTATVTVAGAAGAAGGGVGGAGATGTVGGGKNGGTGTTTVGNAGNSNNCAGYGTAGAGGAGSSGAGGAGGTAGASGNTWFKNPAGALTGVVSVVGTSTTVTGGPAGGGGGGDGTHAGGGGGSGGGVIVIFAWAIVHNGTYNASGGAGGTPASGNAGGGGGGSGGLILTYSLSAPTGSGTSNVGGGAAGSGVGTGANGSAGSSGTVLNQVLA